MVDTEVWLALVEIAVAFAGFSALVGILGGRDESTTEDNGLRLQLLLEVSLFSAWAAFLPILIQGFVSHAELGWRIAACGFIAVDLPLTVVTFRRTQTSFAHTNPIANRITWSVDLLIKGSILLVLLPVFDDFSSALYLIAVFGGLAQAALIFIGFAQSAFRRSAD
jgi:hypothetical protein